MTAIETYKNAFTTARSILSALTEADAQKPDVVEARKAELTAMKKDELIELVLTLEKPKKEKGTTVAEMVEAIMVEPACACMTHEQVALLIMDARPDGKTTGKTVASIVSKSDRKPEFATRERVKLDILSVVNG
jgi:hypothetical protein